MNINTMFKYALIKVSIFYSICIALVWNFQFEIRLWMWISLILCSVILFCFKKLQQYSIYSLILSIVLLQFNTILPKFATQNNAYCKINTIQKSIYNSKITCQCKKNGNKFKAILYLPKTINEIQISETYFVDAQFSKLTDHALFGEFSYTNYLKKKGIFYEAEIKSMTQLRRIYGSDWLVKKHLQTVHWIDKTLLRYFSAEHIGLLKALCFGDKSFMTKEKIEEFRRAGLMHIIAVSGMHVGIIQLVLLLIMKKVFGKTQRSLKIQQGVIICLLLVFAWICRFTPSIIRSIFMFTILYYSYISKRLILPVHGLILSAFILLLYNPLQLFDLGFQFSYIATFGLVISNNFTQKLIKNIQNKYLKWIIQASLISLIAQLFLSPLLFYYFGEIPLWFWLFNIPGFIFVGLILLLTFLFFTLGMVNQTLADNIAKVTALLLNLFENLLTSIDHFSVVYLNFKLVTFTELILYCLLLFIGYYILSKYRWRYIKFSLLLAFVFMGVKQFNKIKILNREELIIWNTNTDQCITYKKQDTLYHYSTYNSIINKRISNYLKANNCILKKLELNTKENSYSSNLFQILKPVEPEQTWCILFSINPDLNTILEQKSKNKAPLYYYFGQKDHFSKNNQIKKKYLKYGPTIVPTNTALFYYP